MFSFQYIQQPVLKNYFKIAWRTKQIGIRKIIGASVADIVTMLCKDFVVLVCIAILIASPLALLLMNRWLEGFAYRLLSVGGYLQWRERWRL